MRRIFFIVSGFISVAAAKAGEEMAVAGLDISIDYSNDPFYTQLWFWSLAGLLFLLLLVLLILSGRRSKRKADEKKPGDATEGESTAEQLSGRIEKESGNP